MNYWQKKATICWRCLNAVPNKAGTRGCSWSRKFIPVEGWTAEATTIYCQHGKNPSNYTESYVVRSCPEFISDGREDEE
jgi:hypothetical protein